MNELGGFIVLSGSLFPLLIWFFVSIILAGLLSRLFKTRAVRLFGGIGLFVLIFMLPLADEIVGRLYFNYLCDTKVDAKVYETVVLPAKYWSENSEPLFINDRGVLIADVLGGRFEWTLASEPYIDWIVKIDKDRWILQDRKSNRDLAEKITFTRHYGWLNKFSTSPNTRESCINLWVRKRSDKAVFQKQIAMDRDFLLRIFSQKEADN